MYDPVCVTRGIDDPTALQIPYTKAPFSRASSMAANVSAVSPDCEMAITTSLGLITELRYLNSEAYSTSTGILQNVSIKYLPINPLCHEVPQASITIRLALSSVCLLSMIAASFTSLRSTLTLPFIQLIRHSGCSNISFSIKCG